MLRQFSISHFYKRWEAGGLHVFYVRESMLNGFAPSEAAGCESLGVSQDEPVIDLPSSPSLNRKEKTL